MNPTEKFMLDQSKLLLDLQGQVQALSLRVINLESLLLMSSMGDKTKTFITNKLRETMAYLAPQEALTDFEVSLANARTKHKVDNQTPVEEAKSKLVKKDCKTASKEKKLGIKEAALREKRERMSKK